MASIEQLLAWLENRLQGLVEGGASWLLPGGRQRRELAEWLSRVMLGSARLCSDGSRQAPDLFTLTLPAETAARVDETLLIELAVALQTSARQQDLVLRHPPVVRVVAGPPGVAARVQVAFTDEQAGNTSTIEVFVPAAAQPASPAHRGAYLVVEGKRTFQLTDPLVTIGRDPANTLVLEDMRVSRQHAQLRLVQGQYMIFDLQSTGGTTVNGRPVVQQVLLPGDVLSLAGVALVYGQESAGEGEATQKLPVEPDLPEEL